MTSPTHGYWQIQDAKQRFSEMIRAVAHDGPVVGAELVLTCATGPAQLA